MPGFLFNVKIKLADLNPKWTGLGEPGYALIDGVVFDCPHCRAQRLGVKFTPPIDRNGWAEKGIKYPVYPLMWNRKGDTFETLTLSPSIDTSSQTEFHNHWHGFIEDGFLNG